MISEEEYHRQQREVEAEALAIWQNEDNDGVWDAIFRGGVDIAGELLTRIEGTPDFTVGDLTHEQCIANIVRYYPILGPPPHHFGR